MANETRDVAGNVINGVALAAIAKTLAAAQDAAELLAERYETRRAVTLADALAPDAPKVWDEANCNVSFHPGPPRFDGGRCRGLSRRSGERAAAVIDALSSFGVKYIPLPATPERVWRAIRAAHTA